MPRFKIGDEEVNPVYYADDNAPLLAGDNMDRIIVVLEKIASFEGVSGLRLNLSKCEIMTVNCDQEAVDRLLALTGMKQVQQMKHLGVIIHQSGEARG